MVIFVEQLRIGILSLEGKCISCDSKLSLWENNSILVLKIKYLNLSLRLLSEFYRVA